MPKSKEVTLVTPRTIGDELNALRAFDTKSMLVNGLIIQGIVIDSFTLSVGKGIVEEYLVTKGKMFSIDPIYWNPTVLGFDKESRLRIFLYNVKDKRIHLTIRLKNIGVDEDPEIGRVQVEFGDMPEKPNQKKDIAHIAMRKFSDWKEYQVQSKHDCYSVMANIGITSIDVSKWAFEEVKVEIFTPYK